MNVTLVPGNRQFFPLSTPRFNGEQSEACFTDTDRHPCMQNDMDWEAFFDVIYPDRTCKPSPPKDGPWQQVEKIKRLEKEFFNLAERYLSAKSGFKNHILKELIKLKAEHDKCGWDRHLRGSHIIPS